ncbi:hypothetical protein NKH77_47425 [Streptomyces sp. M19]
MTIEASDTAGGPVASVAALTLRPVSAERLATAPPRRRTAPPARLDRAARRCRPTGRAARRPARPVRPELAAALGDPAAHPDLDALAAAGTTVPGTVFWTYRTTGDPDPVTAPHDATAALLATLRDWLADERFAAARLVVVTAGAVGVAPARTPPTCPPPPCGAWRAPPRPNTPTG